MGVGVGIGGSGATVGGRGLAVCAGGEGVTAVGGGVSVATMTSAGSTTALLQATKISRIRVRITLRRFILDTPWSVCVVAKGCSGQNIATRGRNRQGQYGGADWFLLMIMCSPYSSTQAASKS